MLVANSKHLGCCDRIAIGPGRAGSVASVLTVPDRDSKHRRGALERFVRLSPGVLERRERLEQLRALEAGMHVAVARVDTLPLSVDTPADLEKARAVLGKKTGP